MTRQAFPPPPDDDWSDKELDGSERDVIVVEVEVEGTLGAQASPSAAGSYQPGLWRHATGVVIPKTVVSRPDHTGAGANAVLPVDAVAVLMDRVHEAWQREQVVGVLLMDVNGAFDHASKVVLTCKLLALPALDSLIRCVICFMKDTCVMMKVEGQVQPQSPAPEDYGDAFQQLFDPAPGVRQPARQRSETAQWLEEPPEPWKADGIEWWKLLGDSTANILPRVNNWIAQPDVEEWEREDEVADWVNEGKWAAEEDDV
ncbi:hypothetical protein FN846DRAFT_907131 [Sphaerosporella brunnea]|uniref:Uncharacterized protein n=1 Tax=Sphaerosporella brunnea TaxID=1250544 RepID=A0A5J5EWI8_9PEZI|nr:hypothetical protein FN846DRAFT_907131 [Sphaerosporella brunnea]